LAGLRHLFGDRRSAAIFETAADYRDPYLQKLIKEKDGTIIWPLIRYSYGTHNLDLPTPAPSAADLGC